jgi:Protein of unknown function (DUF2934)
LTADARCVILSPEEINVMPIVEELEPEVAPPPEEAVDREELARLAYWHWEARGFPEDSPDSDWFWAEEELRRQHHAVAAAHDEEDA